MADDHEAAVQFEDTYNVMFVVGTNSEMDAQNNTDEHVNTESVNVINNDVTKVNPNVTGLALPQNKTKDTSKGKQPFETECDNQNVKDNNVYNKHNANEADCVKYTSTPASNRSSHSPASPASPTSPIMLSPQSPMHWSQSPMTSPNGSAGPSPRSRSPASPPGQVNIIISKEEIMHAYAIQEKAFQEEFLKQTHPVSLKTPPRTRSASHSPARSQNMSVGIDHLDNLVRLMEQLSSLKEENATLRKKCHFLHDTKSLLQVQNEMLLFRKQLARASSPKKLVRTRSKRLQKGHQNRPIMDMRSLSTMERRASDSSNDGREARRDRPGSAKLSQRSQSVGSINIHDSTVDLDMNMDVTTSKHAKRSIRDKRKLETVFSKSLITSKWNQVKKVFSGKPEVNTKTETTCVSAEQLVRANSKYVGKVHKEASIGGSSSQDSSDNKDRQHGVRPSGGEYHPPSPSSMVSDTGRPSLVAEDPVYEEINPTEHQQQGLEPDHSFRSSYGSSFGSDEGSHENSKSTNSNKQQQKKLPKTPSSDDEGKRSKLPSSPQFLTVETQPHGGRRQSTPLVWTAEDLDLIDRIELEPAKSPRIRRSSSFKTTKRQNSMDVPDDIASDRQARSPEMRKSNRSAWGRVKDIIHTRKDSLKRKNRRSNSAGDMLPDASGFDDYYLNYDSPDGSTSQPSSPKSVHKGSVKPDKSPRSSRSPPRKKANQSSPMESPQPIQRQDSLAQALSTSPVDVSALIGGVSEEFTKKMQEWEDKKRRSIFSKEGSISLEEDGSATKFNEDFIRKMEEWERKKGLASRTREETQSPPPVGATPARETDSPKDVLSESFVKTVQEWERVKTKRIKDSGSPAPDGHGRRESRKSRKQEARSSSKSRERDRSRSKYEKQKEREKQKIEKKEQKIEKERQKLEKLKQKLETVEMLSEAKVEGVTSEFARKLHEWEIMKGLKPGSPIPADPNNMSSISDNKDVLKSSSSVTSFDRLSVSHQRSSSAKEFKDMAEISHQRSNSAKDHKEQIALHRRVERDRTLSEGTCSSLSITISPPRAIPTAEANISNAKSNKSGGSSPKVIDDSTSIDINITAETVARLEAQNKTLIEELGDKEEDLAAMQDDVTQLTCRINEMNIENNNRIEHYKRELWATSKLGRYTIETDLLGASINELQRRLQHVQGNQRLLISEKAQLQLQLKQLSFAKQAAEARLVREMQQLALQKEPKQLEPSQDLLNIHNDFEKLCDFFVKIQNQLSELKIGLAERNHLLSDMQHHLLNHEVTNRLLEASIQRKDLQLQYYKHKDHTGVIKRWRTFTGKDLVYRPDCIKRYQQPKTILNDLNISKNYEDTVKQMNSISMEEVEEAYWEWLERLKRQRAVLSGSHIADVKTDETQTYTKSLDIQESASQTVMTLCNIAYSSPSSSPISRLPASPIKNRSAESRQSQQGPHSQKEEVNNSLLTNKSNALLQRQHRVASQISDPDLDTKDTNHIHENNIESETSVNQSEIPKRPPRGRRAKLIRWERRTSTESLNSQKSDDHRSQSSRVENGNSLERSTSTTDSLSNPSWSTPSTPTSANRDSVEVSFTFSVPKNACEETNSKPPISPSRSKSPPKRFSPEKSPVRKSYAISVPYPSHTKPGSPRPDSPKSREIVIQKSSGAKSYLSKLDDAINAGEHQETYAEYKLRTNNPPHSPIIKSRYPRKMRAGEGKASSVYMADSRTWQATPPRRNIRHRKVSSEKRPDISSLIEGDLAMNAGRILQHEDHNQIWRDRAKSDSCYTGMKKDLLVVPGTESPKVQYTFKYQKDQKQAPVLDVINKFERTSSSSGEVFRKSPSPGAIGRPMVSPVHRLKTAEELLQEYSMQRHSSTSANMDQLNPGRDKNHSTSSDKENDKHEPKVKSVIRKKSRENTPDKDSKDLKDSNAGKAGVFVSQAIRKLSVPDGSDQSKTILQDRTNDALRKSRSPDVRLRELPKLGIVSRQAELFQSRIRAESQQLNRQAPMAPTKESDLKIKPDSTITVKGDRSVTSSPHSRQSPMSSSAAQRPTTLVPPSTSVQSSSPRSQRNKGYSRFFSRKVSPSSPTKGGAISALCKQALNVEVASNIQQGGEELLPNPPSSPETKKSKAKFLDVNWLQKPKKFFKVSKC